MKIFLHSRNILRGGLCLALLGGFVLTMPLPQAEARLGTGISAPSSLATAHGITMTKCPASCISYATELANHCVATKEIHKMP
jgi:hypothetical protein